MLYNLASELDRARFAQRAKALMARGAPVELTEKVFKTPNQNRYAHLLIGLVAMEVGESIAFVKSYYFKRLCNPDIQVRGEGGETALLYRNTKGANDYRNRPIHPLGYATGLGDASPRG